MVVIDAIARFLFDGFLELLNGALGEPPLVVDPTKSIDDLWRLRGDGHCALGEA